MPNGPAARLGHSREKHRSVVMSFNAIGKFGKLLSRHVADGEGDGRRVLAAAMDEAGLGPVARKQIIEDAYPPAKKAPAKAVEVAPARSVPAR